MNEQELERLLHRELGAINRTLAAHQVNAGARLCDALIGGRSLILYRVRLGPGERIANVERVIPELAEVIGEARGRRTAIRLQVQPLALELPHWEPAPITLHPRRLTETPAGGALVGMVYDFAGARALHLDPDQDPHTLIVGTTGSGKSNLLNVMLGSMAWATSPAQLRTVTIDLKNTDLRWAERLPHNLAFAGEPGRAGLVLERAHAEMIRRRDGHRPPWRMLIVVDELAQLADVPGAMQRLNDLTALGRGFGVHVWAATQHPTRELLGRLTTANFTLRLCGLVTDSQAAAIAAGRGGSGAERLPGRGAFLWIAGAQLHRFTAYRLPFTVDQENAVGLVGLSRDVRRRWGEETQRLQQTHGEHGQPAVFAVGAPATPEPSAPDPIDLVADKIAELWAAGASKNAMSRHALGKPYGGGYAFKIDQAIARLEERAAATSTDGSTPPAGAAVQGVEGVEGEVVVDPAHPHTQATGGATPLYLAYRMGTATLLDVGDTTLCVT